MIIHGSVDHLLEKPLCKCSVVRRGRGSSGDLAKPWVSRARAAPERVPDDSVAEQGGAGHGVSREAGDARMEGHLGEAPLSGRVPREESEVYEGGRLIRLETCNRDAGT